MNAKKVSGIMLMMVTAVIVTIINNRNNYGGGALLTPTPSFTSTATDTPTVTSSPTSTNTPTATPEVFRGAINLEVANFVGSNRETQLAPLGPFNLIGDCPDTTCATVFPTKIAQLGTAIAAYPTQVQEVWLAFRTLGQMQTRVPTIPAWMTGEMYNCEPSTCAGGSSTIRTPNATNTAYQFCLLADSISDECAVTFLLSEMKILSDAAWTQIISGGLDQVNYQYQNSIHQYCVAEIVRGEWRYSQGQLTPTTAATPADHLITSKNRMRALKNDIRMSIQVMPGVGGTSGCELGDTFAAANCAQVMDFVFEHCGNLIANAWDVEYTEAQIWALAPNDQTAVPTLIQAMRTALPVTITPTP